MKNSIKLISIFAMTAALAACGQSNPNEAMVMGDFSKSLDRQIAESVHFEDAYKSTPQIAEILGPNKRVPSEVLQKIKASGKFSDCRKGEYDGQVICGVEASLDDQSQMFEYAYVKNGEQWESQGGYRKSN